MSEASRTKELFVRAVGESGPTAADVHPDRILAGIYRGRFGQGARLATCELSLPQSGAYAFWEQQGVRPVRLDLRVGSAFNEVEAFRTVRDLIDRVLQIPPQYLASGQAAVDACLSQIHPGLSCTTGWETQFCPSGAVYTGWVTPEIFEALIQQRKDISSLRRT